MLIPGVDTFFSTQFFSFSVGVGVQTGSKVLDNRLLLQPSKEFTVDIKRSGTIQHVYLIFKQIFFQPFNFFGKIIFKLSKKIFFFKCSHTQNFLGKIFFQLPYALLNGSIVLLCRLLRLLCVIARKLKKVRNDKK